MSAAPAAGPVEVTRTDGANRTARWYGAGLLAAFAVIAVPVVLRWPALSAGDLAVDVAAHGLVLREQLLLAVTRAVTATGSPVGVNIITSLVAGVLLYRRRIGPAAYLVVARLIELGVQTAVKNLVRRPRPVWPDPLAHAGGFSFPSGHSAGTAVLCTSLLVLALPACRRRARWVGAVAVVLAAAATVSVAASRVLLGVHYPSDVLGGVLLGIACALLLRPVLTTVNRGAARPASTAGSIADR